MKMRKIDREELEKDIDYVTYGVCKLCKINTATIDISGMWIHFKEREIYLKFLNAGFKLTKDIIAVKIPKNFFICEECDNLIRPYLTNSHDTQFFKCQICGKYFTYEQYLLHKHI